MTKKCKKCGQVKETSEFYPHQFNRDRLFNRCKSCEREISKVRQRADRISDPERFRGYELKSHFGMTMEEYSDKLKEQNGVCAICRQPETRTRNGKVLPLCIDHSHRSNDNRGLLCFRCNTGLGYFNDESDLLELAAQYLRKYM